jgi:phosphoribosyl 1,2-cyclic phosphodiesterase
MLMRMEQKNLNPDKIKAIFISHEHNDHFRGVRVLSKQIGIPVYLTSKTLCKSWKSHRPLNTVFFSPGDIVRIGDFSVHTFLKKHDAAEPCSFRVEHNGINIGVFTDIGSPCENVINHLNKCNAIFLESNYDEDMLWAGSYPYYIKQRIASEFGHLSNIQAKELLEKHHNSDLQTIILSHISQENNTQDIVMTTFDEFKNKYRIEVSNRYAVSEVFEIK